MKQTASLLLMGICIIGIAGAQAAEEKESLTGKNRPLSPLMLCASVHQKIATAATNNDESCVSDFNRCGMIAINERISKRIGKTRKNLSLLLELNSDGSILDVSIQKSCGSHEIDKRAIELVKNAAPFVKNENTTYKKYLIELPRLSVKTFEKLGQ